MTESTNDLNIRITFSKPPESRQSSGSKYRWDRILLAVGALVLLVALLVKIVMPAPSPEPIAGPDKLSTQEAVAEPVKPSAPEAVAEPVKPSAAEAVAEPVNLSLPEEASESSQVATAGEVSAVPDGPAGEADAVVVPKADPVIESAPLSVTAAINDAPPRVATTEAPAVGQDSVQSAPAGTADPQTRREAASEPVSSARDAVITPGQTRILSPAVQRFVLTDAVKANEPVGGPDDIIPDQAGNGVIKLFAYSQVRQLGGEKLIYRWLRGTKVVANVEVGVGSDDWRSHASKYLSKDMRGSWRVELRTAKGELLAFMEFEY